MIIQFNNQSQAGCEKLFIETKASFQFFIKLKVLVSLVKVLIRKVSIFLMIIFSAFLVFIVWTTKMKFPFFTLGRKEKNTLDISFLDLLPANTDNFAVLSKS